MPISKKPSELSGRYYRLSRAVSGLCSRYDDAYARGIRDTTKLTEALKQFDSECEKLKRDYADVFASKEMKFKMRFFLRRLYDSRALLRVRLASSMIDPSEYE